MGYNAFKDDKNYNPKYGINGRVGKKDFSIDGKSWNYRDPENTDSNDSVQADIRGDDGSAEDNRSRNAYAYTNPLYEYSYGQVRDAAKELNITNVNNKNDVKQLLKQIRGENKPKAEEFKDDFIAEKVKPEKPFIPTKKDFTYSPDLQDAYDREDERTARAIASTPVTPTTTPTPQTSPSENQAFTDQFKSKIKQGLKPNLAYSLNRSANTLRDQFFGA